jgi:hypothetical protein
MANQPAGSLEPYAGNGSGEAPILVVVGDGCEPATAVREALAWRDVLDALAIAIRQKGIVAPPNRDRVLIVEAPSCRQPPAPWLQRLGLAIIAVLLLAGSALLPSGRAARAEAVLGEPIPVPLNPFGIDVNLATNRLYVANFVDGTVTVG